MRVWILLISFGWLWVAGAARARSATETGAAARKPTPAVQERLQRAADAGGAGRHEAALAAAEEALHAAATVQDRIGEVLAHRAAATALTALGRRGEARLAWQKSRAAAETAGDLSGQVEALLSEADLLAPGAPELADLLDRAVQLGLRDPEPSATVLGLLATRGNAFAGRRRVGEARRLLEPILAAGTRLPAATRLSALVALGFLEYQISNRRGAEQHARDALALLESPDPTVRSLADQAGAVHNLLGLVLQEQGEYEQARLEFDRALRTEQRARPDALGSANILNNLGNLLRRMGRLDEARAPLDRALAIRLRLVPGSPVLVNSYLNLAFLASDQGHYAEARRQLEQARTAAEAAGKDSVAVAGVHQSLGNLDYLLGDSAAAEAHYRAALTIAERTPGMTGMQAVLLGSLSLAAQGQYDLQRAWELGEQARVLLERLAPQTPDLANSLHNQSLLAQLRGDLKSALTLAEQAYAIRERRLAGSLEFAQSLMRLGKVLADPRGAQRDLYRARDYLLRAVAIRERLAPDSAGMASALSGLAYVQEGLGDQEAAARTAARAWDVVRRQAGLVSGDEGQQSFRDANAQYSAELARYEVLCGRPESALAQLEEGRGNALRQLLLERGVQPRLVPGALWTAHQQAAAARSRAADALARASTVQARQQQALEAPAQVARSAEAEAQARAAVTSATRALEDARVAYTRSRVEAEEAWARVGGALHLPVLSVSLREARARLAPGVLYLAYAIGSQAQSVVLLAARSSGPVRGYTLPITGDTLGQEVERFRQAVAGRIGDRGTALAPAARPKTEDAGTLGRTLGARLLPVEVQREIARSRRVVISPDGALWSLPFAALLLDGVGQAGSRAAGSGHERSPAPSTYLGLWRPLCYAQSLALHTAPRAERPRRPSAGGSPAALVIGNPVVDPAERARLLASRGQSPSSDRAASAAVPPPAVPGAAPMQGESPSGLDPIPLPLPFAEREAETIGRLYGVRHWTGVEPTEGWFRRAAGSARLIHLATHGFFDPRVAMSSGIRLAVTDTPSRGAEPDDANDGILRAYEIYSGLRLRAELVVLSACETGRGAVVRGEGLVGLTRALQAAGARAVVAGQWQVSDSSAARWMVRFHRALRAGAAKDEAIRRAMVEVQKVKEWADPYHWAGFVLLGDPENGGLRARAGLRARDSNRSSRNRVIIREQVRTRGRGDARE